MKPNKKTALHAVLCSVFFFSIMLLMLFLNYIDFSVIRIIYLPLYTVVIGAVLFKKYIFGYIFTISTGLGLIYEYSYFLTVENPSMKGAFMNSLIIIIGFILGVAAQIIVKKRSKDVTRLYPSK